MNYTISSQDMIKAGHQYQQYLYYLSAGLFGAAIIYLIASNWFYFPNWIRLVLPQGLLILSCFFLYQYQSKTIIKESFGAIASLMLGLSLASYGQVYQTGADSYVLFLTWSLLLVFLIAMRITSAYVIFCITFLLAVILAGVQHNVDGYLVTSLVAIIILCLTLLADMLFPKSMPVLLIMQSILVIYSAIQVMVINNEVAGTVYIYRLIEFLVPALLAIYFYYRKENLLLSACLFILSIPITIHATDYLLSYLDLDSDLTFMIDAILILILGIIYTFILNKLFFSIPILSSLPMVLTTFIAAGFLIVFLHSIIPLQSAFIIGLILLSISYILIYFTKNEYILSMAYAITLASYGMILYSVTNKEILPILLLIILLISLFLRLNWFWNSLQAILLMFLSNDIYPNVLPIITALVLVYFLTYGFKYLQNQNIRRTLSSALLSYTFILFFSIFHSISPIDQYWLEIGYFKYSYIEAIFALIYLIGLYLSPLNLNRKTKLLIALLTILLLGFNGLSIVLVLTTLAFAVLFHDKLFIYLNIIAMVFLLWIEYYSMQSTFITKTIYMLWDSLLISLFAWGLNPFNTTNKVSE
ncbi:DUF2157 domain-containing protein [Neisseriaceae bacterium PsAf]|nr:DUF2157 domain-containing protein [Neisseriaceae bacterium PsAf]